MLDVLKKSTISFFAALFAVMTTAGIAFADPYTCGAYNPIPPVTCILWLPTMLPGANWCNGDPGPNQINIYSDINFGGVCMTIPKGTAVPDSSAVGWNNTTPPTSIYLHINSVKVGTGTTFTGYLYTNYGCAYGGGGCNSVGSGFTNANTSTWANFSFKAR